MVNPPIIVNQTSVWFDVSFIFRRWEIDIIQNNHKKKTKRYSLSNFILQSVSPRAFLATHLNDPRSWYSMDRIVSCSLFWYPEVVETILKLSSEIMTKRIQNIVFRWPIQNFIVFCFLFSFSLKLFNKKHKINKQVQIELY